MKGICLLTRVAALATFCLADAYIAKAQTSIYDASYDSSGNQVTNTTAVTLNNFTVTGVYVYSTQVTVFVTDGTANGRIFGYASGNGAYFTTLPTVGAQYTDTVTAAPYQGTEELKATAAFTPTGMLSAVTPVNATLSQIANSATVGTSPSASSYASHQLPVVRAGHLHHHADGKRHPEHDRHHESDRRRQRAASIGLPPGIGRSVHGRPGPDAHRL